MKLFTALAFLALAASAQTFTCVGCTDYGPIRDTGYTMQYGARMVWTADVEPGAYIVSLTFVEPVYAMKGQRPINVWVNDVQLLGAFDIIGSVKQFTPITWRTVAADSGGKIVVALTANDTGTTKHSAIVSAISAVRLASGGSGPAPVQESKACRLTMKSNTQLAIGSCPILVSNIFYEIQPGQVDVLDGTGVVRVAIDLSVSPPVGKVYAMRGVSATCAGFGGCTSVQQGVQFLSDDLPVGSWTVTNGKFDANGYTPLLGTIQGFRLQALSGLIQEQSGHTIRVRVNSDVIPVQ